MLQQFPDLVLSFFLCITVMIASSVWRFPRARGGRLVGIVSKDGSALLETEIQQFHGKVVRPPCFYVCQSIPSSLSRPSLPWARSRVHLRRAGRDVKNEHVNSDSSASGRIGLIFSELSLCLAVVSLTRYGRTVLRPSSSPPAAADLILWKNPHWLLMRKFLLHLNEVAL